MTETTERKVMMLADKVISHKGSYKTMAKKGEIVTVVSDNDNVLIVENSKGEKFSVKTTDTQEH